MLKLSQATAASGFNPLDLSEPGNEWSTFVFFGLAAAALLFVLACVVYFAARAGSSRSRQPED